jgi:hypothetical protein
MPVAGGGSQQALFGVKVSPSLNPRRVAVLCRLDLR